MKLPILNKTYDFYDDGKITYSRHDKVIITDIISFDKIDQDILSLWKEEIEDCNWLYNKETDYFVKGHLERDNEDVVFVRCLDNSWFSLGFWGGRLDIDESKTKWLKKHYPQ